MDETKQMFMNHTGKNEEQIENYIQAFAKRKFYSDFRQEMNRSVRKIIESWMK